MKISKSEIQYHQLQFKFEAGTSRGSLKTKDTWYLKLYENEVLIGIGEAGPLEGLSMESISLMPAELKKICSKLRGLNIPADTSEILELVQELVPATFPSIQFALETALLDAKNGSKKMIFDSPFYNNQKPIPINGLVWMGSEEFMRQQIEEKLKAGYSCIKMKIGAIDFHTELDLLKSVRKNYSAEDIVLRVDANGAFSPAEALDKLSRLAELDIHSIEQPIKAGQTEEMKKLCKESPLPIALDEELIGIDSFEEREELINKIQPQYLVLKPSLIGGIYSTLEWVRVCEKYRIGWWLTSMLESNIGLNAICQLADYMRVDMPQGLGTGQLYHNNIESPLTIKNGQIYYDQNAEWGST